MSEMEDKESVIGGDNDDEERRTAVSEEFNPNLRDAVIELEISNRNDKVFSSIKELFGKVYFQFLRILLIISLKSNK